MGNGSVFLEDSEGHRHADLSPEQIGELLQQIGGKLDHCILHLPGDTFLQCAGDKSGLLIQYSDGRELFESGKSDFDPSTVAAIFGKAINGDMSWREEYVFRPLGSAAGGDTAASIGTGFAPRGSTVRESDEASAGGNEGSLKDQLLRAAKSEIKRETSRGIGNLVRKGIRSITGR